MAPRPTKMARDPWAAKFRVWHEGITYDVALGNPYYRDAGQYKTVLPVKIRERATGRTFIVAGEGEQIGNFHPVWVAVGSGKRMQVTSLLEVTDPLPYFAPKRGKGNKRGRAARGRQGGKGTGWRSMPFWVATHLRHTGAAGKSVRLVKRLGGPHREVWTVKDANLDLLVDAINERVLNVVAHSRV